MPEGSKNVDRGPDNVGNIRVHCESVRAILRVPTRVSSGEVFDVIARRKKFLIVADIGIQKKRATSCNLVESLLVRQNVFVLNQLYDNLVEMVKGTLGIAKNNPHPYNDSLHRSESEILLLLGTDLLLGRESDDLPVRQ
jgi:hypothetical protein